MTQEGRRTTRVESRLTSCGHEQAYIRSFCKSTSLEVSSDCIRQMTNHQRLVPVCRKDIRESGTAVDDKVELRQVDSIVGRRITYLDITKGGLYNPIKANDTLQTSFKDLARVFDT